MAASIIIEQESGRTAGSVHPHNGYYAGDFTSRRDFSPPAWHSLPSAFGHPSSSAE